MRKLTLTLLAALALSLSGCSWLAKEYVRHVAHTTDLGADAPPPDPSAFAPTPASKPQSVYAAPRAAEEAVGKTAK